MLDTVVLFIVNSILDSQLKYHGHRLPALPPLLPSIRDTVSEANPFSEPAVSARLEGLSGENGAARSSACKTPSSCATSSSASTALPSSGGSCTNASKTNISACSGGSGTNPQTGAKRHLLASPGTGGSGSGAPGSAASTGGSGGGKRLKTAKEKVSLQERMSRLRKDLADKKSKAGTPGGAAPRTALGISTATAASAAAARSSLVMPTAAAKVAPTPAPLRPVATSTPTSDTGARLPVVAHSSRAARPDAPSAPQGRAAATGVAVEAQAIVAPPATASARAQPVATADNPPNMISSLHSLTSLMVKKEDQPAARGKWDRLAAGGGSAARAVPALRKAEEARLLEEKRARERAASRLRAPPSGQPGAPPAQREDKGVPSILAMSKGVVGAGAGTGAAAKVGAATAGSKETTLDGRGGGKPSGVAQVSVPLTAAPLRVTGMLSKLVPGAAGAARDVEAAATHRSKGLLAVTRLPAPFRPSTDDVAGPPLSALQLARAAESDSGSLKYVGTSASASVVGVGTGGGGGSVTSSSDKIEMKIRDQRAQIALKRNARVEKLKAEEEKKKVSDVYFFLCSQLRKLYDMFYAAIIFCLVLATGVFGFRVPFRGLLLF